MKNGIFFPFGGILTETYMKGMATGQYITFSKIKNIVREVFKNFLEPRLKITGYIILRLTLENTTMLTLRCCGSGKECDSSALAGNGTWDSHLIFHNFGSITRFLWKINLTEVDLKSIVLYKLLSIVNKTINWYNFLYIKL